MKKISFLCISVSWLLLLPLLVAAEPYLSLNEICVVEKKGNGYWFLNEKEGASKANQMFGAQRNQFEWFFAEDGQIKAKVYPALRDAIIQTPNDLYKQRIHACALTRENQQLAASVSFKYRSQDRVCACLFEKGRLNCEIGLEQLRRVPYEELVLFFESKGTFPKGGFIEGMVPSELSEVWNDLPNDYVQSIEPCELNTVNTDTAKEMEPFVRNLRKKQ